MTMRTPFKQLPPLPLPLEPCLEILMFLLCCGLGVLGHLAVSPGLTPSTSWGMGCRRG